MDDVPEAVEVRKLERRLPHSPCGTNAITNHEGATTAKHASRFSVLQLLESPRTVPAEVAFTSMGVREPGGRFFEIRQQAFSGPDRAGTGGAVRTAEAAFSRTRGGIHSTLHNGHASFHLAAYARRREPRARHA